MTRPNFTVNINGNLTTTRDGLWPSTVQHTSMYCKEVVSGSGRRKKPEGWKPPTTYHFDRDYYVGERGYATVKSRSSGWTDRYEGVFAASEAIARCNAAYAMPPPYGGAFPAHRDKALVRARLKMKDQDVNLGVAFAERNKTARLVGDTASKLAKSMLALKRGDLRRAARELGLSKSGNHKGRSIPQQWLELQYGWKPLLSDVHGATEALAKRPKGDWRVTGKGSSSESIDRFSKSTRSSIHDGDGECHGKIGAYVRIDALPQNDLLVALSSLGITNPLTIAWELVPYSFVVDWFLPIGQFIDSLDAMLGYGPATCSMTNYGFLEQKFRGYDSWYDGVRYDYVVNHSGFRRKVVHLRRDVSGTVPLPTLPRFKDPASLAHMANGLSLLATAFR